MYRIKVSDLIQHIILYGSTAVIATALFWYQPTTAICSSPSIDNQSGLNLEK